MNANPSPKPFKAPATNIKVKRPSSNQEAIAKPAPVSGPSASTSEAGPEKSDVLVEGA